MPSLNVSFSANGPHVQVAIAVSMPHAQALKKAGKPVPAPVQGTFLVDTGASSTCADPDFVKPLGLTPTGTVQILTPSSGGKQHSCYQYDIMLIMVSTTNGDAPFVIPAMPVLETKLRPQGIDGLIGRDVLQKCSVVYNGHLSFLTLSY